MRILLLAALAFLMTGCSHIFVLVPNSPKAAFDDANREGNRSTAHVIMHSGDRYSAQAVRIAADSTSFTVIGREASPSLHLPIVAVTPPQPRVFPTWDIRDIRVKSTARGTGDGLFLGTIAGVVVGAAMGSLNWNYLPTKHSTFDPTTAQVVLDTFGGACIGAAIGTFLGSTSIIRFQ